jgi:hypothetical protein
VLYRVSDPDDEFSSSMVLCHSAQWGPKGFEGYAPSEFEWKPVGSSYDGNAVSFGTRAAAEQAVGLIRFGVESVVVSYS